MNSTAIKQKFCHLCQDIEDLFPYMYTHNLYRWGYIVILTGIRKQLFVFITLHMFLE